MIIEAKANRESAPPVDPAKRFDLNKPERESRVPLFVALLIAGVGAFIKSAFPAMSQSGTDPSQGGDSAAPGNQEAPRAGRAVSGNPVDPVTTGSIGNDDPDNAIGHSVAWPKGFVMPDAVAIAYATPFEVFGPNIAPFFPAAFGYRPENDNAPVSVPADEPLASIAADPNQPLPSPADNDDEPDDDDDDDDNDDDDDDTPDQGNRAPITMGSVRLNDVFAGQVVLIGLSQLLFGTIDPDGDILTINDITLTGGTLVQTAAGWSFATVPGMLGIVTFTYNISDGLVEIVQTATLQVVRNTVLLTPHDDVFVGTPWDDDIDALAGDDIVDARAGNDTVVGGLGNDHINGGDGDDELFGGLGDDAIFGGRGNDIIGGGEGDDRLFGDEGNDVIDGNEGNDTLMGGAGDDILDGGDGDDLVEGEDGADIAYGAAGNDVMTGGAGDDVLDGGEGDDDLSGGDGDDMLVADAGDDVARGDAGNDTIEGHSGSDTLIGGLGDDLMDGGEGDDTLRGDDGDDTILAGAGDDTAWGGEGNDQLFGEDGDDELYGDAGDDHISGGVGDDELYGSLGNDTFSGDAGYDEIDGGVGYDILDYAQTSADLYIHVDDGIAASLEVDEDLFENIEEIIGGRGDDTFVVGTTATVMAGGEGQDLFIFTVNDAAMSEQIVQQIMDFVVGDRIHVADYEISHWNDAAQDEQQRFEELYDALEEGFESDLPIRVRHAFYDDMDHTIIEADIDRNDFYELAIVLDGVAAPLGIGNHFA
ncbi:calcium-binding protein [Devosia lacusdianchii]|uniref:calcium-binding protein n=1 Tax=Devosia lacusdianchii TaxID=2917991 RepID=UPI001F06F963|nr:cadherin-like domain-containing protein [Devosia sp. JXJ CY 41]